MPEKEIKKEQGKPEEQIVWQAPEYEYNPKDVSWHWLSVIIGITLIGFAIWQKNFLFAIFIAIAVFVVNIAARRFPAIWECKIDKEGISISLPNGENAKFYPFEDLESFDIHKNVNEEDEYKELVLKTRSRFSSFVKINIYQRDEEKIKDFLLKFIPQKEHGESLIDSLVKLIGF